MIHAPIVERVGLIQRKKKREKMIIGLGSDPWADEDHLATIDLGNDKMLEITDPNAVLGNKSETLKVNNAIFIRCNFCSHEVIEDMFVKHIKLHIQNKHIEEAKTKSFESYNTGSRSPFIEQRVAYIEPVVEVKESDVKDFLSSLPMSKLKEPEEFSFRKIKDVSATSSRSNDGRYSDFTLFSWFGETPTTYNAGYSGGQNSFYGRSSERLQIHLVYDSLEQYFTISGRVYKTGVYSDYETEEGAVPDRICLQDELMKEIKMICLFFRCPPKAIYKRLLKVMRKELQVVRGQVLTENHAAALEELSKPKNHYSAKDKDDDLYQYYS